MNIEVTDGGDAFVFLCQSTGNVRKIDRFDSHIKRVTRLSYISAAIENSLFIWICSKLQNILFYNRTTPKGIESISITCCGKFVDSRFAKFCLVLKSIRGDTFPGNLCLYVGMCRQLTILVKCKGGTLYKFAKIGRFCGLTSER